jgi:hypothetical protein
MGRDLLYRPPPDALTRKSAAERVDLPLFRER